MRDKNTRKIPEKIQEQRKYKSEKYKTQKSISHSFSPEKFLKKIKKKFLKQGKNFFLDQKIFPIYPSISSLLEKNSPSIFRN